MNNLSASEAYANFQEVINRSENLGERIIIEKEGKPAVAIINIQDLEKLEAIEDALDSAALSRAVKENQGFTTLEAITESRKQ